MKRIEPPIGNQAIALNMEFFQKTSFRRSSLGITLIASCLVMACLQMWRAEQRSSIFMQQQFSSSAIPIALNADQTDAKALQWRPVKARGAWLKDGTIFLDNKVYQQRVGYHVLTPLQLDGSEQVVLVNRGWVAAPRLRSEMPFITTPEGVVDITGIADKFEQRTFEFGKPSTDGIVWQHVREGEYRERIKRYLLPIIVLQTDATGPRATVNGLIRDWSAMKTPENPAWRHYGYAAMWVVLAALITVQCVIERRHG